MTETDKNTLPQELPEEIKQWIEKQVIKEISVPYRVGSDDLDIAPVYASGFQKGATALYAHLKPLIDGKDDELRYEIAARKSLMSGIDLQKAEIEKLQNLLDAKDEEIERLNKILEDNVKADKRLQKLTK